MGENVINFYRNITHCQWFDVELTAHYLYIPEGFALDFDDAYQYAAAEKHGLTLVSFDSDFDRTERGRKTPAELLKK